MTAKELLQQKPDTQFVDRYSGAVVTAAELSPIIVEMISTQQPDVEEFCGRFDLSERSDP